MCIEYILSEAKNHFNQNELWKELKKEVQPVYTNQYRNQPAALKVIRQIRREAQVEAWLIRRNRGVAIERNCSFQRTSVTQLSRGSILRNDVMFNFDVQIFGTWYKSAFCKFNGKQIEVIDLSIYFALLQQFELGQVVDGVDGAAKNRNCFNSEYTILWNSSRRKS